MPTYEVEINGQSFEIDAPDDNSVRLAVRQMQAKPPGEWDGAAGKTLAASSGFLDGVPVVGPYLDAGTDRLAAGIATIAGEGSYGDNLERIQSSKTKAVEANPMTNNAAGLAGGVVGTVPLALAAPGAFGIGAGSMMARTGASALTGLGLGTADSAVRSGGDVGQSLTGGAVGLGTGAVGPAIGKMVGAGVRYFRGATDDALSGLSRPAQRYLEGEFADPARVAMQREALQKLGPDAMLADVSPDWLGVARGSASRPGVRSQIVDPLTQRSATANARLQGDVSASLGPDPVPSRIDTELGGYQNEVGKSYGPVMRDSQMYDFTPIADALDSSIPRMRGDAQRRLAQVRGMLNEYNTDMVSSDPAVAFQTRQAIDGMLTTEADPKVIAALSEARQMIDDGLTRAAPGIKEVDAQYSELARQREALGMGRPILNNEASAMRPVELEKMLNDGALPQGMQVGPSGAPTRMKQGALGEVYRAIGTKANDTTALRNIMRGEGDWNREKLGMLFGKKNADTALNAIDRETVFGDTTNRVTRGSDTEMARGFSRFLNETAAAGGVPTDMTVTGAGVRGAQKLAQALLNKNAERSASRYAEDIGRLSVAQGSQRDAIIEALMSRAQSRRYADNPKMQAVLSALVSASGRESLR